LLDPEVAAAQAIAARSIPNHVGLVVAVESTGYTGDATARQAQIIPGWSVEKAKRMGASTIKLLAYYHPIRQSYSKSNPSQKNSHLIV
jgi:tagatose 1,6-diphosphate aldolase